MDLLTIAIFALAIVAPGAVLLGKLPAAPRTIAELRDYVENNFGGRMELVRAHAGIKLMWFRVSPSPRVVVGSHGWLFYAMSESWSARGAPRR